MNLSAAILTAALSLPSPWRSPEPEDAYHARLETIATAVAVEASEARWRHSPELLAAVVLATWWSETRLSLEAHDGSRTGDNGRALCLGSVYPSGLVPRATWRQLTGTSLEATRRCARATIRVWLAQYRQCVDRPRAATTEALARGFAGYGYGRCVAPPSWARDRARRALRLAAQIRRPRPPPALPAQS